VTGAVWKDLVAPSPVTTSALVGRINRKLAPDEQSLRTPRGRHARVQLGAFHIVYVRLKVMVMTHVNVGALGRELGVLESYEGVE
jgi:hypothetical protein